MFAGYASFAGVELWNNERVMAYLAGSPELGVQALKTPSMSLSERCGCPTILPYVCDPGPLPDGSYLSPAIDPAPWYDPAVPDSVDFAGLFVESITPFDLPIGRTVSAGAILGGSLGPLRLGPRTITVTGWLLARTCCAAEYGLRWLAEALAQTQSCAGCSLGDLSMLRCCPPEADSCRLISTGTADGTTTGWTLTAAEGPAGVFTITIDDPNQANVLSDPFGAINNNAGALEECVGAGGMARLMVSAGGPDAYYLLFDAAQVTLGASGPSGIGWTQDLILDTTLPVACPDEQQAVFTTRAALQRFIAATGGTAGVTTLGDIECAGIETGSTVADIARLMHRVGLVDGPSVTDRHGTCCNACGCTSLRVQFTLASESPYIFSDVQWCVEGATFPADEFCIDWDNFCDDCAETVGTQPVETLVPRASCGITLRADQTWCADNWDPGVACPPIDCIIDITGTTESPGSVTDVTSGASPSKVCEVDLGFFGDWTPHNFTLAPGAFPDELCGSIVIRTPVSCDAEVAHPGDADPPPPQSEDCTDGSASCEVGITLFGFFQWLPVGWNPATRGFPPECAVIVNGGCPDPAPDPSNVCPIRIYWNSCTGETYWMFLTDQATAFGCTCFVVAEFCEIGPEERLVRLVYNECTDTAHWEPMGWTGSLLDPCKCYRVGETEVIRLPVDPDACLDPTVCPINVICDPTSEAPGTWEPIGWTFDPCAPFPDPNCTYTVGLVNGAIQNTDPVVEIIEIADNIFIPDCGPLPIIPPAPSFPSAACYCTPVVSRRICCTFQNPAQWNDATSVIQIAAGSNDIRNLRIAAYQNPYFDQGVDCPCDPNDPFWRCKQACTSIEIPQLPPGAIITIDSRVRAATVRFINGTSANGLRYVESSGSTVFDWFDVAPCSTFCVVVSVDATVADDAMVSIGMVGRFLASGG